MSYGPTTDSYIETGATTLHVAQTGEGTPALVFLHYYGGSTRTWHPVIEQLEGLARCVAIDHRGWGRSSQPESGYLTENLADDAVSVIGQLGLDDYILVGHSMGGKTAQVIASRRPEGLRGVVLVAPAPAKPADIPAAAREQMAGAYTNRESVIGALEHVLSHATLSDELREQVIQDSLAGGEVAKREWPAKTLIEDVSENVDQINVPVLVLAGEFDQVEPVALMESNVIGVIPGAELEIIQGTGHLIPLEQPEALAGRIAAFRDQIAHSGS